MDFVEFKEKFRAISTQKENINVITQWARDNPEKIIQIHQLYREVQLSLLPQFLLLLLPLLLRFLLLLDI